MTYLTSLLTFLTSVATGVAATVTDADVKISADGNAARVTLVGQEAFEVNHEGEVGEESDESRGWWCSAKYHGWKAAKWTYCTGVKGKLAWAKKYEKTKTKDDILERFKDYKTENDGIDCTKYATAEAKKKKDACENGAADFAELGEHVDKKEMAKMLFENMEYQMEDLAEQMKEVKELLEV
jgi:hypothetical protein